MLNSKRQNEPLEPEAKEVKMNKNMNFLWLEKLELWFSHNLTINNSDTSFPSNILQVFSACWSIVKPSKLIFISLDTGVSVFSNRHFPKADFPSVNFTNSNFPKIKLDLLRRRTLQWVPSAAARMGKGPSVRR